MTGYNDIRDAYRHAYWSAAMARKLGRENAKKFADAHENLPNNPILEKAMDQSNNRVGREAALDIRNMDKTTEEIVEELLDKELLQTWLGDKVCTDNDYQPPFVHSADNDPDSPGGWPEYY
jgi:hypothetical protein